MPVPSLRSWRNCYAQGTFYVAELPREASAEAARDFRERRRSETAKTITALAHLSRHLRTP